jgi:hypothetical protein
MRAKKPNPLSRRRSRRPDGRVYRDLRRARGIAGLYGRRRFPRATLALLAAMILAYLVWTWMT